jgi:hypothetical protein
VSAELPVDVAARPGVLWRIGVPLKRCVMLEARDFCEICGLKDQPSINAGADRVRVTCSRCGDFEWEPRARKPLPVMAGRREKLSAFIREQNTAGITPLVSAPLIRQVEQRPIPKLRDRAMRGLATLVAKTGFDSRSTFSFSQDQQIQAVTYCGNVDEVQVLVDILQSEGLIIVHDMMGDVIQITPRGLIQAEQNSGAGRPSAQGFVAMSFDPAMNDAYLSGFDVGIRIAGYRPLRIDRKEHINGISDEILSEIRRSRFLVADYTHMNNGVYFEAGVAVGLGIPVIATCRSDHLTSLHFDIRHINTLRWDEPTQLAADLGRRISAVIGDGPIPSSQ